MWHSLIAFIDNKTLFQIGIGLCRISFPMRLLLPFEWGWPLLHLSSDDSSPAVDSDLSQQKKKKKQTNPNITNLSPLMTRWQPPQPKLPSPAPDIGACPRQSMKGGWRWVWLRTRGCWERSLFGESLPSRGPLPPFFWIWERGKREVQRDLDSFRERREIECEMESLPNGMDILGDSCVRQNLRKNGTEKLLQRSQETQLKVNGERTPVPWKDLKLFGHS